MSLTLFSMILGRNKDRYRWTLRDIFSEEQEADEKAFKRSLMDSEPGFEFAEWAKSMRSQPESQQTGSRKWLDTLSTAAQAYLAKLDLLYKTSPLVAIKLAAITAASAVSEYQIEIEATKRMGDWLLQSRCPEQDRLELATAICDTWPNHLTKGGIEAILLDLIVALSGPNPALIAQAFAAKIEEADGALSYLVIFGEDKVKLLTIARNVKNHSPDLSKWLFAQYLNSSRRKFLPTEVPETEIRAVAEELFALINTRPSPSPSRRGYHYALLAECAFPDAPWFPVVLQALHQTACETTDRERAAFWHKMVAINAMPRTALFTQALADYARALRAFWPRAKEADFARQLGRFLTLIRFAFDDACKENPAIGRNISLPPNPAHPVVEITRRDFLDFIDWLDAEANPVVLTVLAEAIESADKQLAEIAVVYMTGVFEKHARRNSDVATQALGALKCNDWYSNVTEPRKSRCLGVVRNLMPCLTKISPESARLVDEYGVSPSDRCR